MVLIWSHQWRLPAGVFWWSSLSRDYLVGESLSDGLLEGPEEDIHPKSGDIPGFHTWLFQQFSLVNSPQWSIPDAWRGSSTTYGIVPEKEIYTIDSLAARGDYVSHVGHDDVQVSLV